MSPGDERSPHTNPCDETAAIMYLLRSLGVIAVVGSAVAVVFHHS